MAAPRVPLRQVLRFVLSRPFVTVFWSVAVLVGLLVSASVALVAWARRDGRVWERVAAAMAPWALEWRKGARDERATAERYSNQAVGETYRLLPEDSHQARAAALLSDPATWFDAAYLLVAPWPVAATVLAIGWLWLVGTSLLTEGTALNALPWQAWAFALAGVAVFPLLPVIVRSLASLQVALAQALLGPRSDARLAAEAEQQRARRLLAVEAAEAERRRIERDLHDGAQQRLTALALDLGMARQKLASDPAAAGDLLERAHADAKQALGELRNLARGIHPTLLTDRGLPAAVSALAARASVPVDVTVDLPRRLSASVESAAYFLVAETLTNVGRHAEASAVSVTLALRDDCLAVEVRDDGRGGADPAGGTGLAGLADRIAGLDGRLEVRSPVGGPTVILAEIPCES